MGHLEDSGVGYFYHLRLAWLNSLRLMAAGLSLLIHGAFPFLLTHSASSIIDRVKNSFPKNADRILIRFNTKWKDDPDGRQWRVLVNGAETLARRIYIKTDCETVEEYVGGEQKFHFLCVGKVKWKDGVAEVF